MMISVPPRLALVTGATGAIGPGLVDALIKAGWRVRVLVRKPVAHERVEIIVGDISDATRVDAAVRGADVVFHLAALLHIESPGPELEPEYERVNVIGTRNIVEAAERHGVGRIVFFSTIAVYGDARGSTLTDDSEPLPQTIYGRTKLAAEKIVLAAGGTVLRLGAVYGPGVKGNYRRLLTALSHGWFISVGSGRNRRTLVYERDVVAAALAVADATSAVGRTYNVTDGRSHTVTEIVAAISEAIGRQPRRIWVPASVARAAAAAMEVAARLVRAKPPVRRATVDKFLEEVVVTGDRLRAETGFESQWDLRSGWRDTVEQLEKTNHCPPWRRHPTEIK